MIKSNFVKLSKLILQSRIVQQLLGWLIVAYIKLVYATSKNEWINDGDYQQAIHGNKPTIICFWHGRLLMMTCCWPASIRKMKIVISHHRDGEFIAKVCKLFGFGAIRGSSRKGGVQALKEILRTLKTPKDNAISITPDGPRGPRRQIQGNIITIAKMSGATIIPLAFSSSKCTFLSSWDRFMVPHLFAKNALVCGDGIKIAKDADKQTIQKAEQELNKVLNELTEYADKLVGANDPFPDKKGN